MSEAITTLDELSERLASVPPGHLSAERWADLLAGDAAYQQRVLDTLTTAAVPPGPDYLAGVLAVLKVAGDVVGVAGGVESAVTLVQTLVKA